MGGANNDNNNNKAKNNSNKNDNSNNNNHHNHNIKINNKITFLGCDSIEINLVVVFFSLKPPMNCKILNWKERIYYNIEIKLSPKNITKNI